jgi:hypothetical protein
MIRKNFHYIVCLMILSGMPGCIAEHSIEGLDEYPCLAGEMLDQHGNCIAAGCTDDHHCDDGDHSNGVETCNKETNTCDREPPSEEEGGYTDHDADGGSLVDASTLEDGGIQEDGESWEDDEIQEDGGIIEDGEDGGVEEDGGIHVDAENFINNCLTCLEPIHCVNEQACIERLEGPWWYQECRHPCSQSSECDEVGEIAGISLYCNILYDGGRCACTPQLSCPTECYSDPDGCADYMMACWVLDMHIGNVSFCTTECLEDHHCPTGWFCCPFGSPGEGKCVEKGCRCKEYSCDAASETGDAECQQLGFERCLQIPPETLGTCTQVCQSHADCPNGYHCEKPDMVTEGWCLCRPNG